MTGWNFAQPDWFARLKATGRLVPDLPLFTAKADKAVRIFDKLRVPDIADQPAFAEAAGEWFRDIVRVIFGSLDDAGVRHVPEVFALVPKKNSKTTNGGGLMLTALLANEVPRGEFLFVAPTQEIADLAFQQAAGMIDADPEGYLQKRFQVQEHKKTIRDRTNKAFVKVKTFDMKVMTGSKPIGVLVDELHIMGSMHYASRVIGQIRGALESKKNSFLLIISTQSDEPPAGVFRAELMYARAVRDGRVQNARMLPILYEFPEDMQADQSKPWADPANWPLVTPNLGRSQHIDTMISGFAAAKEKGDAEERRWASQHLNIEIGLALHSDRWAGADFWLGNPKTGASNVDKTLTMQEVIRRSEVVVVGIDGGGLDDLLGLAVLGREKGTGKLLLWCHAWAHEIVKDRRKEIAPKLEDLNKAGQLTFVKLPGEDVYQLADMVFEIEAAEKLAEENAVGVDSFGVAAITNALTGDDSDKSVKGIDKERIVGISQGWKLNGAIKDTERDLAGGNIIHAGQELMNFAVGNAKIVPHGNAISIDKQVSGSAKIDPLMATLHAKVLMGLSPHAKRAPSYQMLVFG
ncbi:MULTISPECIES: terminase large subunit [unclassified Mesorhizobium]|uniref:terminase large subunit domain-containing protein n=1 Tax=unclassified Mesorhizobium TaxID=325217 RepID=UPI000FDB2665|nr:MULTISPECIES: terminase large subunit [unclassified Mesorhizobium]TGT76734.1 terminase large subunit [Mesorhizobium sp. M2E.F.Ca.ET.166.01.1.1]TGW02846.1 terminase large subunit [Mesorhizobium sp. M2E.F.Ca.ET.154.01.1.1]